MTTAAAFTPPRVPPSTKALSIVQVARTARRNPLEFIPDIAYRQPIVSGRTVLRWHIVNHPPSLKRVFLDNVENYPKSTVTMRLLRPAIGDSLFTAEGAHWRWQRRATAPAFQHRKLLDFAPMMTAAGVAARDRMLAATDAGRNADVMEEMVGATFDVVANTLLSGKAPLDREAVSRAITRYLRTVGRISLLDVLGAPDWIPRLAQIVNRGVISGTQGMMQRVIAERRADPESREDLLALLLKAEDPETGRRMTDEELRDNLLAFVVAGHETTALTLAWALYLLAAHPEIQARVAAEAQAVCGGGPAGRDHLDRLTYTKQVIEEALRLYPPAAMLGRTARSADTLCGREIRPGDTVILPIYTLHRHEALWADPDRFNPDNFAPDKVKARDRFAWLPFGAGPRVCIGLNFAIIEAVLVLATIMGAVSVSVPPGFAPRPVMTMTLRPEGGMPLTAARR